MSQFIITHLYVNIRLMFLFPRTTGYSSTELVFSLSFVSAYWHIVGTPETFVKVRKENERGEGGAEGES